MSVEIHTQVLDVLYIITYDHEYMILRRLGREAACADILNRPPAEMGAT